MGKEKGFTLVELLVAMAISGIVVAAVYTAFVTQQKSYTVQNQVAETQQNARVGLDLIAREVRMAGYGQPTWALPADTDGDGDNESVTDPVTVVDGGGGTDRVTVIGCFDPAPPTLSEALISGATTLKVTSASVFDNINNKDNIFIGGFENAKVTNKSGTTLTIDTDPNTSGNQGTVRSYNIGDEVSPVRAVTYYVEDDTLRRDENTGAGGQPLAENIEGLQITYANKIANISVFARSRESDPTYRDATHGDHYRRRMLISNVNVRNLLYKIEEE